VSDVIEGLKNHTTSAARDFAFRRLADESFDSGWLSPEPAIGIRRVKGIKWLGRKIGNWRIGNQTDQKGKRFTKSYVFRNYAAKEITPLSKASNAIFL